MAINRLIQNGIVIVSGRSLSERDKDGKFPGKVLVMIHGRGSTARNILGLSDQLLVNGYAIIAPQAPNNTWYPYSFLVPEQQNEPHLSTALGILGEIEAGLSELGVGEEKIYLLGFSQGACLALEYAARNAKKYGGIVAFSGGLIGSKIEPSKYDGDFSGTPVFIGSSDPDPHIPVERVLASEKIFHNMNANIHVKIYQGMGHAINQDELNIVNSLIFGF